MKARHGQLTDDNGFIDRAEDRLGPGHHVTRHVDQHIGEFGAGNIQQAQDRGLRGQRICVRVARGGNCRDTILMLPAPGCQKAGIQTLRRRRQCGQVQFRNGFQERADHAIRDVQVDKADLAWPDFLTKGKRALNGESGDPGAANGSAECPANRRSRAIAPCYGRFCGGADTVYRFKNFFGARTYRQDVRCLDFHEGSNDMNRQIVRDHQDGAIRLIDGQTQHHLFRTRLSLLQQDQRAAEFLNDRGRIHGGQVDDIPADCLELRQTLRPGQCGNRGDHPGRGRRSP